MRWRMSRRRRPPLHGPPPHERHPQRRPKRRRERGCRPEATCSRLRKARHTAAPGHLPPRHRGRCARHTLTSAWRRRRATPWPATRSAGCTCSWIASCRATSSSADSSSLDGGSAGRVVRTLLILYWQRTHLDTGRAIVATPCRCAAVRARMTTWWIAVPLPPATIPYPTLFGLSPPCPCDLI